MMRLFAADLSYAGLPPAAELTSQPHYPAEFSMVSALKEEDIAAFYPRWNLQYSLAGVWRNPAGSALEAESGDLSCARLTEKNIDVALQFFRANYLRKFASLIPSAERAELEQKLTAFALSASIAKIYFQQERPVALFIAMVLASDNDQEKTLHVGFAGIDVATLTRRSPTRIKRDWFWEVERSYGPNFAGGKKLSAKVAAFNFPSIAFCKSLGMEPERLPISPAVTPEWS